MSLHDLLLLLCLSLKKIMRKKSLVDYFQSQVMIYIKYLTIQREKNMNKVIAKEIKRGRQRKGSQVIEKKTTNLGSTTNQAIQRIVKKRAQFIVT